MKKITLLAAMLLATLSMFAQDLTAELTAQIGHPWEVAYESSNATALTETYAKEVAYVNDDGSVSTKTRANILADWKKYFATYTGTMEFVGEMVTKKLPDGKASLSGNFTQTRTNKETGESITFRGLFEHQAVQENGQWKLCHMKVTEK